ncbi:Hypothetical predicted protein [Mytilus galloprovincialis]|uniref:Large ribosomal subunit protein bL17m n=1 Tax=Mytilus galloprovincialis TaxID=29158 RepID=A0A8B6DUV8_MYTGA|nr:Hypothetical predicted protein [Mytilus galloprovincialis]
MNSELQVLAIEIFNLCVQNNISIEVEWVPREENKLADFYSKIFDFDDWQISDIHFKYFNNLWGPFTCDVFADFNNNKRFQFSYWKDLQSIQNPSLRDFARKLPIIAEASKSKNTVKKYSYAFKRFSVLVFKLRFMSTASFSDNSLQFIYLFLIQSEVSSSVLNGAFYGIKWEHDLNLYSNVFTSDFLSIVLEGGVRLLSKPVNKKEPITHDIIKRVIDKFGLSTNLADLRICCLVLLSYAGFLRYSELSHLKASNLRFYDSHVEITIVSSKTDVYRQGNVVVIAKTNSDLCPVAMLKRYLEAGNISLSSDEFIFRAISFLKSRNSHILCKANKPLSYTRARELLLSTLSELINIASRHGDKDKYAMEVADYWLLEKDLIHKLFKVIVPRYENNRSSYTKLYMLPKELPGYGKDMGVLELKDNPWPQVVPKQRETKYFLTNMLVDELRKEHHRTKRSPFVNKILDTSADNIDIDSIQNQYILDNLVDNDEGKTKNDQSHENKND